MPRFKRIEATPRLMRIAAAPRFMRIAATLKFVITSDLKIKVRRTRVRSITRT